MSSYHFDLLITQYERRIAELEKSCHRYDDECLYNASDEDYYGAGMFSGELQSLRSVLSQLRIAYNLTFGQWD